MLAHCSIAITNNNQLRPSIQNEATIIYGNPEEFHTYLTIGEIEKRNETSRIKEVEEMTFDNWF